MEVWVQIGFEQVKSSGTLQLYINRPFDFPFVERQEALSKILSGTGQEVKHTTHVFSEELKS